MAEPNVTMVEGRAVDVVMEDGKVRQALASGDFDRLTEWDSIRLFACVFTLCCAGGWCEVGPIFRQAHRDQGGFVCPGRRILLRSAQGGVMWLVVLCRAGGWCVCGGRGS